MTARPSLKVAQATPADDAASTPGSDAKRRTFLRMMSHEMRTPLNSIIGFADILAAELHGPLGAPEYQEYARIIGSSGHRLLSLVNGAIEIIRLESGNAELDLDILAPEVLVEDALLTLAQEARSREVRLDLQVEPELPTVLAEARGLRTITAQLVQNAISWSPMGASVVIRLTSHGPLVRLEVCDQGPGVDPDQVPRLMQAFEQGEDALNRHNEGAGLGWRLVRLLADAMGGRFEVDPGFGRGLTAIVTLRRGA